MKKSIWRTLVRVVGITDDNIEIVIPGISYEQTFKIPRDKVPFEVKINQRLHVKTNLEAETEEELMLSDWEPK